MDTTQLLKGVLDVAVLAVITSEDGYGYDVVRRLRAGGLDEVAEASVYGTLRRLYASGALSTYVVPSDGGPHRKYYAITPQGAIMLDEQRRSWSKFSSTLSTLIGAGGHTAGPQVPSTQAPSTQPASPQTDRPTQRITLVPEPQPAVQPPPPSSGVPVLSIPTTTIGDER